MAVAVSRRELIVNAIRIALLRWRVVRVAALPRAAMVVLTQLDAIAARWTSTTKKPSDA